MTEPTLVVAAALVRTGRVLAARRTKPGGKWEFPGGKCEQGESPLEALRREIFEELGIDIQPGAEISAPDGVWPINAELVMRIWYAEPLGEPRPLSDHDQIRWLAPTELVALDWLPADIAIAQRIAADLGAR